MTLQTQMLKQTTTPFWMMGMAMIEAMIKSYQGMECAPHATCLQAHSAVEKLLKALMQESGVFAPFSMDLAQLGDILGALYPEWPVDRLDLDILTQNALQFEIVGEIPTQEQALESYTLACQISSRLAGLKQPMMTY